MDIQQQYRTCTKCKNSKIEKDFGECKKPHPYCKACRNEATKQWVKKNREEHLKRKREKRKDGIERRQERERYKNDPEYRARVAQYTVNYRKVEKNRLKYNEYNRQYRKKNPSAKIRDSISRRLNAFVKKEDKAGRTLELAGCSIEYLKLHLESLWKAGMSWDNYGVYKKKNKRTWHIDHIIPCTAFDLTKPEEQRKCFHYSNLQPLWADENMRKGNYVPDYQI